MTDSIVHAKTPFEEPSMLKKDGKFHEALKTAAKNPMGAYDYAVPKL
jgi:hypothetical protein